MGKVLIAGCGFIGLATARLFSRRGWEVVGTTHSPESAAELTDEPFPVVACDISNPEALRSEPQLNGVDAIVHCASSGRGGAEAYERVYYNGARNLRDRLPGARLLFTSSTSVYAQVDGSWVTEQSAAEPDRETGRWLRATEDLVLEGGGAVTRLAGIYGPRRSVLLRKFFSGEAVVEGDGSRWINQIHREDVASALVGLIEAEAPGIFNLGDNEPVQQRPLYEWLAARFARPLPPSGPIDPNRKRGWTSKRVSNQKLRATGWVPRFGSFYEAVVSEPDLVEGAK